MPRSAGRPRRFSDDAIFRATAQALSRLGYGGLTLEAVASEVGCTRQALVRRFGSKHSLICRYLEWVIAAAAKRYDTVRAAHDSPLGALRARFLHPVMDLASDSVDPAGQSNILSFFLGAREDPQFRALLSRLHELYGIEVTRLVREAQQACELREGDAAEIAHLLIAATTGEIVLWAADPEDSVVQRIERVFDAALAPYLAAPSQDLAE